MRVRGTWSVSLGRVAISLHLWGYVPLAPRYHHFFSLAKCLCILDPSAAHSSLIRGTLYLIPFCPVTAPQDFLGTRSLSLFHSHPDTARTLPSRVAYDEQHINRRSTLG